MPHSSRADSFNRLGAELWLRGDTLGAKGHYLASLHEDPNFIPALANMAGAVGDVREHLGASEVLWRRAIALVPDRADFLGNLGCVLYRLERYEEAREFTERACTLAPDDPNGWYNLALLCFRERKNQEALGALDKVESLGRSSLAITNDRAHAHLALGQDLPFALSLYESRWHTLVHLPPWDFYIPEWQGEDLRDKRILIHAEQGFGDTLMCARFIPQLITTGAHVTLAVHGPLVKLLWVQPWALGVDVVDIWNLPDNSRELFDFQSPLYSMMRWLGIQRSSISPRPYLSVPSSTTDLNPSRFNIGICWASGTRNAEIDWRKRHAPLPLWFDLTLIPGVELWSLQFDDARHEIESLGAEALIRTVLTPADDFLITAKFVMGLDLVIAVDTAIAHLAGALGKPVILLSQFSNCWRWWDIDQELGTPWYETMTIYRQPSPGDWKTPLARAKGKVTEMVQDRRETFAA